MNKLYYILPVGTMALAACSANKKVSNDLEGQRPNVLLIYADDIGYGDLSCNETSSVKTPHVDKLASEGIRFTNAHCAAATSTPSRYALLTGEYAWRRKGTGIAAGNAAMIIKPDRYTLADMFKEAGYHTGVIGKWHLGLGDETGAQDWNDVVKPNPADIGFDYSYIMAATADRTPCMFMENGKGVGLDPNDPVYVSYEKNFPGEPTGKDNPELLRLHPSHGHDQSIVNGISRIGYMKGGEKARWRDEDIADSIVNHAIRFLERNKDADEPFFLYLATNDIHVPRVPHERFVGKSGLGARGDALLSFDWSVGQVMEALKRSGALTGLSLGGFNYMDTPVRPDFWRVKIDNDGWFKDGKYWKNAHQRCRLDTFTLSCEKRKEGKREMIKSVKLSFKVLVNVDPEDETPDLSEVCLIRRIQSIRMRR